MLGPLGGIRGHRVSGVYWGAGRECRYSGARRGIGGIRRDLGLIGGVGAVRGVGGALGADRECRYSGPESVYVA